MMVGVIMAIGIILWVLRGKRRTKIEREERVVDAIFRMESGRYFGDSMSNYLQLPLPPPPPPVEVKKQESLAA